jgi:hypothetical protein
LGTAGSAQAAPPTEKEKREMLWFAQRVRELQEALSATIAREISSRNARVAALQKCWDGLRASFDVILDQRGPDTADLPGGASGLLVRSYAGARLQGQESGFGW